PCAGWLPIVNANEEAAAPAPDNVIGIAVSSGTVTLCGVADGVMFNVSGATAVCGGNAASVTLTVIGNAPDCVGVPDSTPAAVSDMPAGNVPAAVQRYGAAIDANPPMAASAVEYGWLTMPPGRGVVATRSGSKTRIVSVCGCVLIPFASVPTTTNVKMPEESIDVAVKVPVVGNWATGEISVTPGGSDPDTTEKVKGSLPPTASMLARYG